MDTVGTVRGAVLLTAALGGCISFGPKGTEPVTPPPEPTQPVTAQPQTQLGKVTGTARVKGNTITVTLLREELCRKGSVWEVCDEVEAGGESVSLTIGGRMFGGFTDADGTVTLDLSEEEAPRGLGDDPITQVKVDNRPVAVVDLTELDVYPEWQEQLKARREEEEAKRAEAQRSREEREAERAQHLAELAALDRKCSEGDAKVCYELGKASGGRERGVYYQRACELDYQMGCIALQDWMNDRRAAQARRERQEAARAVARARDAARDPLRRATNNYINDCMVQNGGLSAEGPCKESLTNPSVKRLIEMQCMSLCRGDKMDRCESRCQP